MKDEFDEDEFIEILRKKAAYFLRKKIPVHISLKNGRWLNGNIKEIKPDFLVLNEFKIGKQPVFFIEIFQNGIEEFKKGGGIDV